MKSYKESIEFKQFKQDLQQDLADLQAAAAADGDGTVEITFEFFESIFEANEYGEDGIVD